MPVRIKTFVTGVRLTASVRDLLNARAARDRRTTSATIRLIVEDTLGGAPTVPDTASEALQESLVDLHDRRARHRDADQKRDPAEREVIAIIDELSTEIVGTRSPRRVAKRGAVRQAYIARGGGRGVTYGASPAS